MDNISHLIHHQLQHAMDSPEVVNRTVGESMRHIGAVLTSNSAAYLPLRDDEILVQPHRLYPASDDAIVLIKRMITTVNSFLLLADRKTTNDVHNFDLFGFKLDEFNLSKTQFYNLDESVGKELIRQLDKIINSDGLSTVQAVVLKDYFKNKDLPGEAELFSSEVEAAEPPPEEPAEEVRKELAPTKAVTSMLPAVSTDGLL